MKNPLTIFFGVLAGAAVIASVLYLTVFSDNGDITTKRVPGFASPLGQAPQPKCDEPAKAASLPSDRAPAATVDEVAKVGRDLLPNDDGAEVYEVFYDVQSETDAKQTRVIWLTKTDRRSVGNIDAERTAAGGPWRITAVSSCP
jgi:hypothetical protein